MEELIGTLIAIGLGIYLLVIFLKAYGIQILTVAAGLVIISILYYIAKKLFDNAKRRKAKILEEKAAETARVNRHKNDQEGYFTLMSDLGADSLALFESMPKHLMSVEELLNQAEIDFSEGAFAPFWDSIENAAKRLGSFDEGVQKIKAKSSQYTDLIKKYENIPPQFPLDSQSVEKLSISSSTANRMNTIVRAAQRNFQFASIYEQRKTNQILVAGFTNLGQALSQMASQISDSLESLSGSVVSMTSTVSAGMDQINANLSNMEASTTRQHGELMKTKTENAVREKRILEMLDNIQYHRKPIL